jgi:hypothetical protein
MEISRPGINPQNRNSRPQILLTRLPSSPPLRRLHPLLMHINTRIPKHSIQRDYVSACYKSWWVCINHYPMLIQIENFYLGRGKAGTGGRTPTNCRSGGLANDFNFRQGLHGCEFEHLLCCFVGNIREDEEGYFCDCRSHRCKSG